MSAAERVSVCADCLRGYHIEATKAAPGDSIIGDCWLCAANGRDDLTEMRARDAKDIDPKAPICYATVTPRHRFNARRELEVACLTACSRWVTETELEYVTCPTCRELLPLLQAQQRGQPGAAEILADKRFEIGGKEQTAIAVLSTLGCAVRSIVGDEPVEPPPGETLLALVDQALESVRTGGASRYYAEQRLEQIRDWVEDNGGWVEAQQDYVERYLGSNLHGVES